MPNRAKKSLWLKLSSTVAWLGVVFIALAGGTLYGFAGRSEIMKEAIRQEVLREPPSKVFERDLGYGARNYLNLLILGCDEDRYYAGRKRSKPGQLLRQASRSDMMLVVKVDFDNNRISGISIPRDLRWSVPGYRAQKINAFHAIGFNEGGADRAKELARQAAEGVVGFSIDRVVVLNFEAFQKMIDMLGGVEVYVTRNMDYDDNAGGLHIHLKKGRQVLNGYDAMCYVRFRHDDSDFKRQERQKDLMMSVKDRALQKWQVSPEVVDQSIELMGRAFSAREMASLALFARKVGSDNIKMDMVPVLEIRGSYDLELDIDKLKDKLRELRMGPESSFALAPER